MKYIRPVAFAAIGLAATFSLTACGGEASGKDSSAKGSSPSSSTDGGSSKDGPDSGEGTSSNVGAASASTTSGGRKFCRTSDLNIEAVDSSPDGKTGDVTVQMTNKGSKTCSVTGFAGVDLKDADGTSAPVARSSYQPRTTNLKLGDTATFNITYPVDKTGDSLATPTKILVTPPNETHTVSLAWPAEALKLKGPYDDRIKVNPVGIAN